MKLKIRRSGLVLMLPVVLTVSIFGILIQASAQTVSNPAPVVPWHIQDRNEAIGNFFSPPSYRKSILYLAEGGAVVSVQYTSEEWGAVRINEAGKTIWQAKVDGPVKGISKIGDDFLLFYSDEDEFDKGDLSSYEGRFSKTIQVAFLDGKSGKTRQFKPVFTQDKKVYMDAQVLNRADGSFSNLIIRVSKYKNNSMNLAKEHEQRLNSELILLADIDAALNIKMIEVKAAGKEGLFAGCELGKNDDIFFSSILDDQLLVERIQKNGAVIAKLGVPLVVRTIWNTFQPVAIMDAGNPEAILIGLRYSKKNKDVMNQVFEFNFSTKKVSGSGEQELNKEYKKSMEPVKIKGMKDGDLDIEALRIVNIVTAKETIAIVKEIQYNYNTGSDGRTLRFRNDALVIELYDRQWKLLQTFALDKMYESFTPVGRSVGVRLIGEKLYCIMPALKGALNYSTLYAIINTQTRKLEAYDLLPKENLSPIQLVEGDAILWFADGVLMPYMVEKGGLLRSKKDYHTIWQKVKF